MNKIKVTLSEKNPPRIGDELFIGPDKFVITSVPEDETGVFHADVLNIYGGVIDKFRGSLAFFVGKVVTRTEEEDGA